MASEGDWEFSQEIAKGIFDFADGFDYDVFQKAPTTKSFNIPIGDMDLAALEKRTKLWSIWEQICSLYQSMDFVYVDALAFRELEKKYEPKSPRNWGMKWRCQKEFENFVFRLYALLERMAQLSNIYHDVNLALDQIFSSYWTKHLKDVDDDFTRAVKEFKSVPGVEQLLKLRKHMTHHFELDLVGIGWPPLESKESESGHFKEIALGAKYPGAVSLDDATNWMRETYAAIVELLKKVEPLVLTMGKLAA